MTPQERELITGLLQRLRQAAPPQQKDAEADALIRRELAAMPDAGYSLVQTVLIQEMALQEAHQRLQQQGQPQGGTSFLGRGSVPASGPWGQPQRQAPMPGAGGWGGTPGGPMAGLAGGGAGSFLRSAAMTAAGVAGGALLFHGISSMFSGAQAAPSTAEHGGDAGGAAWQPSPEAAPDTAAAEDYGASEDFGGGEEL